MATMTITKPTIETAFERMGMVEKLEELWDVVDEIELDRELELSWEECQRGEHEDVFDAIKEIKKELQNERQNINRMS